MRTATVLICSALTWCGIARGVSYQIPGPRVFASPRGECGLKILPSRNNTAAIGIFFAVNPGGSDRVIWKRTLLASPWSPHQVLIHERHNIVITLDNANRAGHRHPLVIYGSKGQVVRDFALQDLFTKDEIARHAPVVNAQYPDLRSLDWRGGIATFIVGSDRISGRDVPMLEIIFRWGKNVKINLETGWIRTWKSKPGETPNRTPEVVVLPATGA